MDISDKNEGNLGKFWHLEERLNANEECDSARIRRTLKTSFRYSLLTFSDIFFLQSIKYA